MATRKKKVEVLQVSNFHVFAAASRAHLKTQYPFLSADQIKGKLQETWKKLDDEQRSKYTKTRLKITPTKEHRRTEPHEKRQIKQRVVVDRVTKKDKVEAEPFCDTPEYVKTDKLHGFRKQHSVAYKNDFAEDEQSDEMTPSPGQFNYTDSDDDDAGILITRSSLDQLSCAEEGNDDNAHVMIPRHNQDETNILQNNIDTKTVEAQSPGEFVQAESIRASSQHRMKVLEKLVKLQKAGGGTGMLTKKRSSGKRTADDADLAGNDRETAMDQIGEAQALVFKSPKPKSSSRKRQKRNATEITVTPNLCKIRGKLSKQQTPATQTSTSAADNNTTPQMDIQHKLTLYKVNKAPQKRRQSHEISAATDEKLKAVNSGRRVTRSLLASQTKNCGKEIDCMTEVEFEDNEGKDFPVDVSDEEKKTVVKQKGRLGKKDKPGRPSATSRRHRTALAGDNDIHPIMNPSGDAWSQCKLEGQGDFKRRSNITSQADCMMTGSSYMGDNGVLACQDPPSQKGNKGIIVSLSEDTTKDADSQDAERNVYSRPTRSTSAVLQTPSQDSSSSEDLSQCRRSPDLHVTPSSSVSSRSSIASLRKLKKKPETLNPVLERVLQGLRNTSLTTNENWNESDSNISSPRLLSPALSGISEFSSVSGQSLSSNESMKSAGSTADNVLSEQIQTLRQQSSSDSDLCDMFNEVTPPEQKTQGQYKTTRTLNSGSVEANSNLFQHDMEDDSLFG